MKNILNRIKLWWILKNLITKTTETNARITVVHELNPEANAMIQALNSRSPGGFFVNIREVLEKGFKNFMKVFYVGYGHKSIGDCGSTTLYADGISMLSAKAIQDWFAYCGQETSTRFIDVSGLGYVDPVGTDESRKIIRRWFDFYENEKENLIEHLKQINPIREGDKEDKHEKAIEKRAFDVLRAFLPAGAKTNASWHTNLRQAADHLAYLKYHPLPEISAIGETMLEALREKYPSSFSHKRYEETETYRREVVERYNYFNPGNFTDDFSYHVNFLKEEVLAEFRWAVENRPQKTDLPKILNEAGSFTFDFLLDFGSFRDWQRHRSALQRMPLLTMKYGFKQWYLDQMPGDMQERALGLIEKQVFTIQRVCKSELNRQYYIAMGFQVSCRSTIGFADISYITELRSDTTVHPTVRQRAHQICHVMEKYVPGLCKHANLSLDDFDIRRADQDIVLKK